jgi:1,4-dihydroxy-2-naphthoate octaprenyltransferase
VFLLPVFLFAVSERPDIDWKRAVGVFMILHLLVYPSSNGYNSYMDRDESPVGGLRSPLQPTRQLYYASLLMDALALVLASLLDPVFALGILLYISASRAYSYRGIRLKKHPFLGFATVLVFQGGFIFFISYVALGNAPVMVPLLPCLISSLLIGALYPLTQIYQHAEDRADGVITISYLAGKRGTFILSMLMFLLATFLLAVRYQKSHPAYIFIYLGVMFPVVLFFLYWMSKVWQNEEAANFRNSLRMNALSTLCTTIFITLIIIYNH